MASRGPEGSKVRSLQPFAFLRPSDLQTFDLQPPLPPVPYVPPVANSLCSVNSACPP
jgi:hypothetical protein